MHKRYLVTGKRRYRNHDPGAVFEARLDPDAERRAIERGNIRVLEVIDLGPKNGRYGLPDEETRDSSLASTAREGK